MARALPSLATESVPGRQSFTEEPRAGRHADRVGPGLTKMRTTVHVRAHNTHSAIFLWCASVTVIPAAGRAPILLHRSALGGIAAMLLQNDGVQPDIVMTDFSINDMNEPNGLGQFKVTRPGRDAVPVRVRRTAILPCYTGDYPLD